MKLKGFLWLLNKEAERTLVQLLLNIVNCYIIYTCKRN